MTARTQELPAPSACALCDVPRQSHCQHYFGRHVGDPRKGWVEPSNELRLARMLARRAARTNEKENSRG